MSTWPSSHRTTAERGTSSNGPARAKPAAVRTPWTPECCRALASSHPTSWARAVSMLRERKRRATWAPVGVVLRSDEGRAGEFAAFSVEQGLRAGAGGSPARVCPQTWFSGRLSAVTDGQATAGDYAIEGGPAEERRLAVLSQIMSGPTTRLFGEIGVADGWECLDVGSGGGQVALALGGLVAPSGAVTGVDTDDTVLAHATTAAREQGVANVVFERADAYAMPYRDRFDLAYARLVLCYLTEPVRALREMTAAVKPGGVVA